MFTIKPLDEELIQKESEGKRLIVTFENHSVYGGLGSAVAEVMAEQKIPAALKRVGVKDRFGQVGTPEFLQKEFGLTAEDLEQVIRMQLGQ